MSKLRTRGVIVMAGGFLVLVKAFKDASNPLVGNPRKAVEIIGGLLIASIGYVVYMYGHAQDKTGLMDNSLDIIGKSNKEKK